MSVLTIEDTTINGSQVTVTALVEDMCLVRKSTLFDLDEWAPALCSASFELADDESIPLDESSFCSYLDQRDLFWQLVDVTDWYLAS